jgi:hypothetical protein
MGSRYAQDDDDFYSNPQKMFDSLGASIPDFMRPDAFLSVEEATKEVEIVRKQLFKNWDKLHSVVLVHENTIRQRWGKVGRLG